MWPCWRVQGGLEAAAKEVEQNGGRALVVATDVAQWDEVDAAWETFVEALRRR
jgi:NAD(P)-dependent dehydrogenase (short-subunit alcohol dehydrogenase family)